MDRLAIILLGPQGSGKGTQGKLISKRFDMYYFEIGQILRNEAKKSTPLAKEISSSIDNGLYLPDTTLIKMVSEHLNDIPENKSVIFDSVTRTAGQSEFLINYLKKHGFTKIITIYLDIPEEETFTRLTLRAIVEGRKDDTHEKIALRLKQNHDQTLPILADLRKITDFYEIDGNKSIHEVEEEINIIVKKYINE